MRTLVELIVSATRWCGQMMVTATIRALVIGLAGMGLIWLGAGNEWGKIPMVLGFVLMGGATGYWLIVTILPRTIGDKAAERFPEFGANLQGMYSLGFAYFLAIATMVLSDINLYPKLVVGLVLLLVGLGLSVAAPGVAKKLSVFNWRMGIGLGAVTLAFLWVHLPAQTQSRISFGARNAGGMRPSRILFTLESLRAGSPAFFRSIPNSDGKSEPAVWVYFDEEEKAYYLYDGPGSYESNGDSLVPADRNLRKKIMGYLEVQEARKLDDDKKSKDEQKAAADAETARQKADADAKLKAKQEADGVALKQRQEYEASLARQRVEIQQRIQQRVEAGRALIEAAQENQRQLARQPISVVSTILESTDKSQDIVLVRPSAPFTYRNNVIQPDQSVVVLDITEVKETSDKNQYELTLHPQTIMSGGRSYPIGRQTESIRLTVRKDNSRSILKAIGIAITGAGSGAGLGALTGGKEGAVKGLVVGTAVGTAVGAAYAVASHGKKFQLTVGDLVPPIIIRPVP